MYKGLVAALAMIVQGLEHTYKTSGQGGVASAIMVLEVAATHYCIKDNKSNSSSRTSSPFGSRESLVSLGKDGNATPNKHLAPKRQEAQANPTSKGNTHSDLGIYDFSYCCLRHRTMVKHSIGCALF